MLKINWIDTTNENLLLAYKDYVEQIEKDKTLMIVTSVLGLMPYKKPSTGVPKNTIFIKRKNKIMTSVLKISWANNRTTPGISFAFMNGEPTKFYRVEDIELDIIQNENMTIECYDCHEVINFTEDDIIEGWYVKCPCCGEEISILP